LITANRANSYPQLEDFKVIKKLKKLKEERKGKRGKEGGKGTGERGSAWELRSTPGDLPFPTLDCTYNVCGQ
jgi:hypothetical protein